MATWAIPLALVLGQASGAHAAAVTVPAGLNPGDTYRIMFVTSTQRDATSSIIADYNAFVTTAANLDPGLAGLGTTWASLASTATVNVLTNLLNEVALASGDNTIRIYNTEGALIATGVTVPVTGLYGGLSTIHTDRIADETGFFSNKSVWTGTGSSGNTFSPLGQSNARLGNAGSFLAAWTQGAAATIITPPLSIYGISGLLTVPVPEPSTLAMLGSAIVALGLAKIRGVRK